MHVESKIKDVVHPVLVETSTYYPSSISVVNC